MTADMDDCYENKSSKPAVGETLVLPVPFTNLYSLQAVRVATLMRYSERSEEARIHNRKT